ncbi:MULTISPECIES: hypothetical protein [Micrococcus]|uniref:DNA-binding PadR family transcriptional regulator n=1 Tax=Micrococcus yunnanensis TaxID=566027 RepID=A0ABR6D184_9MICC|nr:MULTISPECIES: hypothetical protein [Micrococcus]MBA9059861.1 DNA-binding PadR family transcriptional regulator [Micrococcus yunnanensis]MBU8650490.1 hypothetical protein [Micrococcus luteus]MBY0172198.1 hypothetical protein [Micrococcus luteus]MBY0174063.1 hypothetical protein [Micrococcus luteus]MBY0180364.1 hypothetical protein [Micrococcus luteus]
MTECHSEIYPSMILGEWRDPDDPHLHTTLKKLRDAGFIEEFDGDDARRVHRLTPGDAAS